MVWKVSNFFPTKNRFWSIFLGFKDANIFWEKYSGKIAFFKIVGMTTLRYQLWIFGSRSIGISLNYENQVQNFDENDLKLNFHAFFEVNPDPQFLSRKSGLHYYWRQLMGNFQTNLINYELIFVASSTLGVKRWTIRRNR